MSRDYLRDDGSVDRAKTLAIGVSLDKPAVHPECHIAIPNDAGKEIRTP